MKALRNTSAIFSLGLLVLLFISINNYSPEEIDWLDVFLALSILIAGCCSFAVEMPQESFLQHEPSSQIVRMISMGCFVLVFILFLVSFSAERIHVFTLLDVLGIMTGSAAGITRIIAEGIFLFEYFKQHRLSLQNPFTIIPR